MAVTRDTGKKGSVIIVYISKEYDLLRLFIIQLNGSTFRATYFLVIPRNVLRHF